MLMLRLYFKRDIDAPTTTSKHATNYLQIFQKLLSKHNLIYGLIFVKISI